MRYNVRCGIAYSCLTKKFEVLGRIVTKHVSWFIVIPIFVSLWLATGIQRIVIENSAKKFCVPYGSTTLKTKSYLKSQFPLSASPDFDPSRGASDARYASLIIRAKDGQSVLRKSIFDEIMNLNSIVYNYLHVTMEDQEWRYQDICAKEQKRCYENKILLLKDKIENFQNNDLHLSYPKDESFGRRDFNTLALGGVRLGKNGSVVSAKALRLVYFLDSSSKSKELLSKEWESKFVSEVASRKFVNITVERFASVSIEEIAQMVFLKSLASIPQTFLLVIGFTISTSLTPNFLRSKPWTGIVSAIGTGMSLASGFGMMIYIGFKIDTLAILVPFLILGIGMDDTFVMLSAWKKTDPKKSVEERMAETYSKIGVSITITSATNIVSFVFGATFAYFESAYHFCIYMAVCLTFDYLYQITFIGAILALFGIAEEKRLHSLIFLPLRKKSLTGSTCFIDSVLCYPVEEENITARRKSCRILLEFWEYLASILTKKISKAVVVLIFAIYLSVAMWSFTKLTFRCSFIPSVLYNSYQHSYLSVQEKNYYRFEQSIQIIINTTFNYADPRVQENVLQMTERFESDSLFSGPLLTQSWLRSYRIFLSDERISYLLRNYDMKKKDVFYYILRRVFLRLPLARGFEKT